MMWRQIVTSCGKLALVPGHWQWQGEPEAGLHWWHWPWSPHSHLSIFEQSYELYCLLYQKILKLIQNSLFCVTAS